MKESSPRELELRANSRFLSCKRKQLLLHHQPSKLDPDKQKNATYKTKKPELWSGALIWSSSLRSGVEVLSGPLL